MYGKKELLSIINVAKPVISVVNKACKDDSVRKYMFLTWGVNPQQLEEYVSKAAMLFDGNIKNPEDLSLFIFSQFAKLMLKGGERISSLIEFGRSITGADLYLSHLTLSAADQTLIDAYVHGDKTAEFEAISRVKKYRAAVTYFASLKELREGV